MLRSPGHVEAARATIRDICTGADNIEGGHNAFGSARKAYLRWVDEAHRQLDGLFTSEGVAEDLFSANFWLLRSLEHDPPDAWAVLRRELRSQRRHLEQLDATLARYQEFMAHPGELALVDTSALVQAHWFEHLDWPTQLGAAHVRLLLPILVLEELDHLKDRGSDRARKQARKLIKAIRGHLTGLPVGQPAALRRNVTLEVFVDDERRERLPRTDAEIIAQAQIVSGMTGAQVRIVTCDVSMEFRARQGLLDAVLLPQHRHEADDEQPTARMTRRRGASSQASTGGE